jgi:hypothetical protein
MVLFSKVFSLMNQFRNVHLPCVYCTSMYILHPRCVSQEECSLCRFCHTNNIYVVHNYYVHCLYAYSMKHNFYMNHCIDYTSLFPPVHVCLLYVSSCLISYKNNDHINYIHNFLLLDVHFLYGQLNYFSG